MKDDNSIPIPAAFMSYARVDDKYGHLTEFRERLSHEIRIVIGEEFQIFQDVKNIKWGQPFLSVIHGVLYEVIFLIPIITPSFFKSKDCRDELTEFRKSEKDRGREDLILPVYYINCPLLNDKKKQQKDKLAELIGSRNYVDWRELRHEPWTDKKVCKRLESQAKHIYDAIERLKRSQREEKETVGLRNSCEQQSGSSSTSFIHIESISRNEEKTASYATTKTEPKIHIVDQMYRGNFTSITEAIENANPGDRILIHKGFYEEELIINKPLEIIGEGPLDEIVVQAKEKSVLLFQTTLGRIVNLTLRQTGNERQSAVDIRQGRLELEGCDIIGSCIEIHSGADPRLRGNRIHQSRNFGIIIRDNGQGILEDNDIFENSFGGVMITTGGNPILYRNRIHSNETAGIFIHEDGQGLIEGNEIFKNSKTGVLIGKDGNPILRKNCIYENKEGGVFICDNGQGTLEDNDIFGNSLAGVMIATGGNPTLRRNLIHHGKQGGVLVFDAGKGILEHNDIFANKLAGIEIRTHGNPKLCENSIHDGVVSGIYVHQEGRGTIDNNDIFSNNSCGIAISTKGNPKVYNNRINKNKAVAIWIFDSGSGLIESNDLRYNIKGAWTISSEHNLRRSGNIE